MNRVMLDRDLRSKLSNLEAEFEFCDEAGRTVGFFLPAEQHERLLYAWARSQVNDEEIQSARAEMGGRTLQEILADLERA
jgi:hypothetical protein